MYIYDTVIPHILDIIWKWNASNYKLLYQSIVAVLEDIGDIHENDQMTLCGQHW